MTGGEEPSAYQAAREYAWRWFEYHAGQRIAVFRLFLALVGAMLAGYSVSLTRGAEQVAILLALLLLAVAFLFWRLDHRSRRLVKLAEQYLAEDEERLAESVNSSNLMFISKADEKPLEHSPKVLERVLYCRIYSFGQVYTVLFALVGFLGLLGTLVAIFELVCGDPR